MRHRIATPHPVGPLDVQAAAQEALLRPGTRLAEPEIARVVPEVADAQVLDGDEASMRNSRSKVPACTDSGCVRVSRARHEAEHDLPEHALRAERRMSLSLASTGVGVAVGGRRPGHSSRARTRTTG